MMSRNSEKKSHLMKEKGNSYHSFISSDPTVDNCATDEFLCATGQSQFFLKSTNNLDHLYDNHYSDNHIYEDICEKCGDIIGNDHVDKCMCRRQERHQSTNNNNNNSSSSLSSLRSFNLFGSLFRSRTTSSSSSTTNHQKSSTAPHKKLEIVHNIDGYVFKNNTTFDLQEITLLKNQQRHHFSDDCLNHKSNNHHHHHHQHVSEQWEQQKLPERNYKTPQNLNVINSYQTSNGNINNPIVNDNNKNDEIIYENVNSLRVNNSYDRTTIATTTSRTATTTTKISVANNVDGNDDHRNNLKKIHNSSDVKFIQSWVTSLKKQFVDYNENTICNTKSIPSFYSSRAYSGSRIALDDMGQERNKNRGNCEFLTKNCDSDYYTNLVKNFQSNLIENQIKYRPNNGTNDRQRNLKCQPILVRWHHDDDNNSVNIHMKSDCDRNCGGRDRHNYSGDVKTNCDSEFVNELIEIFDNFLQKTKQNDRLKREIICAKRIETKQNVIKIKRILNTILLSIARNTIVLTYDKNFKRIVKVLKQQDCCELSNGCSSKVMVLVENFQQLLKYFDDKTNLSDLKTVREIESVPGGKTTNKILTEYHMKSSGDRDLWENYDAFISTNQMSEKNKIDDFIRKDIIDSGHFRIEQFELRSENPSSIKKTISDFDINKKSMKDEDPVDIAVLRRVDRSGSGSVGDSGGHGINRTKQENCAENESEQNKKQFNRRACVLWNENDSLRSSSILTSASLSDEHIYQPLWNFHTVGFARESYNSEIYENVEFHEGINLDDEEEWEVADEFAFSTKPDGNPSSINQQTISSHESLTTTSLSSTSSSSQNKSNQPIAQFDKVVIYYNKRNPSINRISYHDSNNRIVDNEMYSSWITVDVINEKNSNSNGKTISCNNNNYAVDNTNDDNQFNDRSFRNLSRLLIERLKMTKEKLKSTLISTTSDENERMPSVSDWMSNLLNFNVMEDEEDVIMSQRSVSESESSSSQKLTTFGSSFNNSFGIGTSIPKSGDLIPGNELLGLGYYKNKSEDILDTISASPPAEMKTISPEPNRHLGKLSPLFLNAERKIRVRKEKKEKKEKVFVGPVFGVSLDKADLDEVEKVPKLVIECIKVIEDMENLTTNGIYRQSGNKTSMEALKKKLNDKPKREPRYFCLQEADVHTVTGLLKLFFRETSDLIPESVFERIPKNFGHEDSIKILLAEINQIDEIHRKTLKYLIKHLKRVCEHCHENLMTSANLSIVWGPSLFNKNTHSITSLIENDIMNRNVLIKVLIDHYGQIFEWSDTGSIAGQNAPQLE